MIHSLLQSEIENSHYDCQSVERIQPLLPADDNELDTLIERLLAEDARNEFRFVVVAALAANRPVDAKHLAKGAVILVRQALLTMTALRMRGDVARYLMEALATGAFDDLQIAVILFLIAIWCREFANSAFPLELSPKTRELMRLAEPPAILTGMLVMIGMYTEDEALLTIIRKQHFAGKPEKTWHAVRKRAFAAIRYVVDSNRKPLLENLPEKQGRFLAIGTTMRRAAPRFGRNESCGCGSGKKYKRCCLENDKERLRRSTDIAGVTQDEIGAVAERVFTPARMDNATFEELESIDPSTLRPALLDRYIARLTVLRLFDRVLETFKKVGYLEALDSSWNEAVQSAAIIGRKDVVAELMRVRMPDGLIQGELPLLSHILMLEDDPEKCFGFIEDKIRELLHSDDVEGLSMLAYSVSLSKFPAVGIALARGVAPLLSPAAAGGLMQHLLRARDRLNLSPEDAISEVLDMLAVRAGENAEADAEASEAYREAQARFEAQRSLTHHFRAQVETQQKELRRLEQIQTQAHPASAPGGPAPMAAADKSRLERKIKYLEEKLEASRSEEDRWRRDLHGLPAPAPASGPDASEIAREEELLLDAEAQGTQPIRLLDFSRDFHGRLNSAPRHVARSTMAMLGRLAGGDPAAFVGAVRLRVCPAVMRHRIGLDWRLLFRILPDRIDAVDLIPRQDLERRIRTLPIVFL